MSTSLAEEGLGHIDAAVVTELVQAVWSSFVDAEQELYEVLPEPFDGPIVGRIEIHGPTAAVVRIALAPGAARDVAARMLGLAPDDVEDDDVHDATGEITNMIGGNLKSVLDGDHRLGLPSVQLGTTAPDAASSAVATTLQWGEHAVLVTVDPAHPEIPAQHTPKDPTP